MLNTPLHYLMGAAVAVLVLAQTPTIPERVTASDGKPVSLSVRSDTRAIPVDELSSAPLIVRGKLTRIGSYLSKDNRHIWTTYQLLPSQVIVDRNSGQRAPGVTPPYTVTLYGGEVTVSGTKAEVVDSSRRPWTDGTELLLFLVGAEDIGAKGLRPMGGASGMFEISEGQKLKSLRNQTGDQQELDGMPLTDVVSIVVQAARR